MPESRPYLKLHFIVVLWGFTAILGLLIKLSFIELVFYRTLLSAVGLAVLLHLSRLSFFLHPRAMIKMILTGVVIAIHWLLFFGAARYSNASVSLVGLSTTTFWTALLEPVIRKRRVSKTEIIFGIMVIAGLYVIYSDEFEYGLGLLMSIGSALLAAVFSIFNVGFVRKHNHMTIAFYEMIGAFIGTIPFLFWLNTTATPILSMPTVADAGYLLVLAFVCTVYANSVGIKLLKQLSAFASNLVINLEPVYGILLALLFFGESERMSSSFYIGAAIVTITVLLYPIVNKKMRAG
jgi:drug/metabolite transporter (DMT)-like permease